MATVRLFRAANLLTKTQSCLLKFNPTGKFNFITQSLGIIFFANDNRHLI